MVSNTRKYLAYAFNSQLKLIFQLFLSLIYFFKKLFQSIKKKKKIAANVNHMKFFFKRYLVFNILKWFFIRYLRLICTKCYFLLFVYMYFYENTLIFWTGFENKSILCNQIWKNKKLPLVQINLSYPMLY